jgi:STE24 endopeptidase
MFNKLKPLEQGELKSSIEDYSAKVKFPLTNVFVIDGSKRSSKANAFFSGIGAKKKIILFDTLINNHTIEELVAVLAHEVGHFKKKHIIQGLVFSILQTGINLFILSLLIFNTELSKALGAKALSIPLNLLAFTILFTPISHLIGLGMNILSRKNEYDADRYAAETFNGNALQNALKKLSINNLSNPTPHPAYVFMNYSHPPLVDRLRALKKVN